MFRQAMVAALVIGCAGVGMLEAGPPAARKAEPPAGEVAIKATVVSVSGVAHKRSMAVADGKWEPLKTGDVLGGQTLLRTGLGTTVVLNFADRGRVTVRSGTKIGIGELKQTGRKMKARLGLKYGTIRASVDPGAGPNDLRISSAVATLSVRGTALNTRFTERGQDVCVPYGHTHFQIGQWRKGKDVGHRQCTNSCDHQWRQLLHRQNQVVIRAPDGGQTGDDQLAQLYDDGGRSPIGGGGFGSFFGFIALPTCSGGSSYDHGEGEYKITSPRPE
jgi:hypothetical protein